MITSCTTITQVDQVVDTMRSNVKKALERDGKLSELDKRAENLDNMAQVFNENANDVHWKMCCKNLKWKFIIGGIILAVLIVVILIIVISITRRNEEGCTINCNGK